MVSGKWHGQWGGGQIPGRTRDGVARHPLHSPHPYPQGEGTGVHRAHRACRSPRSSSGASPHILGTAMLRVTPAVQCPPKPEVPWAGGAGILFWNVSCLIGDHCLEPGQKGQNIGLSGGMTPPDIRLGPQLPNLKNKSLQKLAQTMHRTDKRHLVYFSQFVKKVTGRILPRPVHTHSATNTNTRALSPHATPCPPFSWFPPSKRPQHTPTTLY